MPQCYVAVKEFDVAPEQPRVGDEIVSIDKQPEYDGRRGTVLDVADKENRGKTERRIQVQWIGRRNKTWLAVSAQGSRWRLENTTP